MVDLKAKPYKLSEEQIRWVDETIAGMSDEEKVGQLFVNMVTDRSPKELQRVVETYHPGGIRYQNAPADVLHEQNRILQEASRIPLLIASNCEAGGNGGVGGGTPVACGAAVAAADSPDLAREVARVGAVEAAAVGCNWNFAPVVDLTRNWRNTIVQTRAYNGNPEDVVRYAAAFLEEIQGHGMATCIKHFPGDGTEENDQHLLMGVNELSCEEWDETFGRVYRELIDRGVMTIMAGHIALPAYSRRLRPGIADRDIRPATLAPEIITDLLKKQLGFNGLVVTDASHMIGMFGASVPRSRQVPEAIAAGCDMFLFFNDREEDFEYMLRGWREGIITPERMEDALRRILGVKAALNLHTLRREHRLTPPLSQLAAVGCGEHQAVSARAADQYVTLVKDRDGLLPLTPQRYPRLKLVYIGGEGTVIAGKLMRTNDEQVRAELIRQLEEAGFRVDGEDTDQKGKMEEFKARYDAVLLVLNVTGFAQYNTMRVKWALPTQQPWYMGELPTVALSLNFPNSLVDIPMAGTYVNAYMSHPQAVSAALEKLAGRSPFRGRYSENVFCGRWETRI